MIGEELGVKLAPGEIRHIETEVELDVLLEEAGSQLVVVDFFAEWCGPCKKLAPVIDALARTSASKVVFAKVDVDAARELAAAQGVKSMPTLLFFRNGVKVDQIVGADIAGLKERVARAQMHPLMRFLRSERLLAAAAGAYLLLFMTPLSTRYA